MDRGGGGKRGGDVISSRVGLYLILLLHVRIVDTMLYATHIYTARAHSRSTHACARAIHQEGPTRGWNDRGRAGGKSIRARCRELAAAPRSWPSRQDGVRGARLARVRCSRDVSRSDGPLSGWTQRGDRWAGSGGRHCSAEERGTPTRPIQSRILLRPFRT